MKTIAITGAGGVLCSEIANFFAKKGFNTALLDINKEAIDKLANRLTNDGFSAKAYETDVLDKKSIVAAKNRIVKDFGGVDILVNGAGGNSPEATTSNEFQYEATDGGKSFFDLDESGVDFVFNLNFFGTFLATQVFAELMVKEGGGNIVNISSMNAFTPLTKIPAYSAAKAGISNFTRWLAVHFAKSNVRVNAIAPGFFATSQNKTLLFNDDGSPTARSDKILRNTPMGRFGVPSELLGTIEWLTDDEKSSFVTGIVVPVDGGFSAYGGV